MFNLREWEEVIKLENELRESAILDLIRVPIADPQRAVTTAYYQGKIDCLIQLWRTRAAARKVNQAKSMKGESNAYNETKKRVRTEKADSEEE